MFETIESGSPEKAIEHARFGLRKDAEKALLCYPVAQAALGLDFRFYRSILLACNDSEEKMPADADRETLSAALAKGNGLAARPLSDLASSMKKTLALLESGIPAASAFFGLMQIYKNDRLSEIARDGILATRQINEES